MSATINATYILPFPSLFPVTSSSNLLISIKQKIFSIGNFIQKELIIFFAKSFQKKIITTKKNIHMKYIIIGGVAGGATAAARIRRNTEKAEIILFEKGEYISYANCGLPYYIGGVIEDRERLFVQTPELYKQAVQIAIASYRYKSSNLARRLADSCQEMQIARKQFLPTGRCGTLHPCFHLTRSIIFTASNAYCFFKYRR